MIQSAFIPMTPFILVMFGATGDLTKKKLIPALFSLFKEEQLPEDFFIIGFARRELSAEEFAHSFEGEAGVPDFAQNDRKLWHEFAKHLSYQQGTFEDEAGYKGLITKLEQIDTKMGACITRIFYLATPPANYVPILDNLKTTRLSEGCEGDSKWTRIGIEKPFGKDIETAKMLDAKLAELFEERQIFRVDHYLGKETVQNLLVFRFANSIFEPVWNKEFIDHVQITFAEQDGINGRGNFFDGVGVLRDVAQNHLLQLVASIAMDMPKTFAREDVRDARARAIEAIECINPAEVGTRVVRGQYEGYKQENNISPNSETDTYVAMKFFIENERFAGVPFYVRAGKAMEKNRVSISLVFKQTCHLLFKEIGCPEQGNILTINIQPNEGIVFHVIAKKPGARVALGTVDMHFTYKEQFGTSGTDAYQRLLLDILLGDQMLFNRSDELVSSWKFITNILQGWEQSKTHVFTYAPGTLGPQQGNELIEKDGRSWI